MPVPVNDAAPPERAAPEIVRGQAELLASVPCLTKILDALPVKVAVLNPQRQVVFANEALVQFAGACSPDEIQGLRPGELLECVHSAETEFGCGTTESCAVCGALQAIVLAQLRQGDTRVCRMRRRAPGHEQALDLDVWATPFDVAGQPFILLALADAAARSRCDWLAHSLLPRALALSLEIEALTAALATQSGETRERTLVLVAAAARRLGATLREESELAAAEAGSLIPLRRDAPAQGLLAALQSGMDGRTIAVDRRAEELLVHTDPDLLIRVLARLLANAVEATPAGGTVTIGCRRAGDFAEFWVRNTGPIPRAVQLRLFQRGFSTKGPGRGYGTYLARLITERFLGGEIAFRSESETVFTVRIPLAGGKED